jgi:hypothetical protein
MRVWPTLVVLLVARPLMAEVTITPTGDQHVSVRVVAAPLAEVLDQLARRTGMRVSYEGSQPRQPITLTVEDRTTVQAVMAVMEGQGLNFGLRMDASGTRVDRLLVLGLAPVTPGSASPSGSTHAGRPPSMQPLPTNGEDEPEDPTPEIDQPDPEPPPGLSPPVIPRRPGGPGGPGGPPMRGPMPTAAPSAPPTQPESLHGGSPFAPVPTPFPQAPPTKEEQPPN